MPILFPEFEKIIIYFQEKGKISHLKEESDLLNVLAEKTDEAN